jgi:Spy/CpxP family protein refolding chaperone
VFTHALAGQEHDSRREKRKMNATKATIVLGALLSASVVLAQAPDSNQAPAANAAQAAPAQPGYQHHNFDPSQFAAHLGQRLGLSSDQVAQITPILAARQQQMQALRADTSLSEQDRHTKARAIIEDTNNKIESILNDQQKQQFEQMLAQRRSHQHNRQSQPSQPQA